MNKTKIQTKTGLDFQGGWSRNEGIKKLDTFSRIGQRLSQSNKDGNSIEENCSVLNILKCFGILRLSNSKWRYWKGQWKANFKLNLDIDYE